MVDIEDGGFDVVGVVFEQQVIALLNELKIELSGCIDDIAIADGEVFDGVVTDREVKGVGPVSSYEGVLALAAGEGVVIAPASDAVMSFAADEKVIARGALKGVLSFSAFNEIVA